MRVELKVKSNGHNVCFKILKKDSLAYQVAYYLDKYKFPININVNQVKSTGEDIKTNKKASLDALQYSQTMLTSQQLGQQQQYDVNVLSEQVTLFESDKQIDDYISTQKLLAHDVEQKLSKLCKALILVSNKQFQVKRQLLTTAQMSQQVSDKNIIKEQLNQIQQKCMETLARVQEERKKLQLCAVCWEHMSNVILIPCMHMVMCNKCPKVRICPVCKTNIQSSAVVYR